jgi:hypothetical protein
MKSWRSTTDGTYARKLGLNDDAKRLIAMDDDNNHY